MLDLQFATTFVFYAHWSGASQVGIIATPYFQFGHKIIK